MKYIIFEVNQAVLTRKVPIIFPSFLVHSEIAGAMAQGLRRHFEKAEIRPVSAGDFNLIDCTCSGKSDTMKLQADPDDSDIILTYDYTHGV